MIVVDANLLLYAKLTTYPEHPASRAWLDAQLNGTQRVGLPWESLLAFLRIATNPRLFPRPLPMAAAWEQVRAWTARPQVFIPTPTPNHADLLGALVEQVALTPALVHDAHLAALAIDYGSVLCSADADFARFPGLRWHNPLQPG